GGNVAAAARLLGIGRATFYRRMDRAGMGAAGAA
ncbi:helix-turn-helix domain-containing protein, partial [Enterococcus faecalis]